MNMTWVLLVLVTVLLQLRQSIDKLGKTCVKRLVAIEFLSLNLLFNLSNESLLIYAVSYNL